MSFIHFGCWNKGLCTALEEANSNTPTTNLTRVMRQLRKNVSNQSNKKVDFVVIAGDNYYPDKKKINGKKVKTIVLKDLLSGFNCLPDNLFTFLLLGNHDIENIKNQPIFQLNKSECFIYQFQKWYSENVKRNLILVAKDVVSNQMHNTQIILIDSNLYDPNITKNIDCYKIIRNNANQSNASANTFFQNLLTKQTEQVANIINNTTAENIIIIGHHPIVSLKMKKKSNGTAKEDPFYLLNMLELFTTPNKKYFYLCADTHLYQKGTITFSLSPNASSPEITIEQYVCGTGGANKNNSPNYSLPYTLSLTQTTYTIQESKSVNGYLYVDCNQETPTFNFKEI